MIPSDDHVRALPKVELHTHVEGAATPATIARIAARNGVDIGVDDPAELYRAFMGRDPKLEPLLERSGLLAA